MIIQIRDLGAETSLVLLEADIFLLRVAIQEKQTHFLAAKTCAEDERDTQLLDHMASRLERISVFIGNEQEVSDEQGA